MISGSVTMFEAFVGIYVSQSGVPALSVEYRLPPEHPAPTPVEDTYAGLVWLHEHVAKLGVDPKRIAIMDHSGGGGITAGLAPRQKRKAAQVS
jgi:acetyl esterase/lipase